MLQAIDYKTGKVAWSHKWEGSTQRRSGLLSTAGNLLFAGDAANNFVAFDADSGTPLWHAGLHTSITNGPITYELDGIQYVVVAAQRHALRLCHARALTSPQFVDLLLQPTHFPPIRSCGEHEDGPETGGQERRRCNAAAARHEREGADQD